MTSADLLHEYPWAIAIALVGLFLLSRYVMRRARERQEAEARRVAAATGEQPLVGPEGYRRARKQFLLTLALLLVVIVVSVLTHFQGSQ
jgi:type II secretory pathway component PulF